MKLGIDIGGAFTDLVSYYKGKFIWIKVETTSDSPSRGVINSITRSNVNMKEINQIIHGQTIAINTVVERKGSKVGLLTTKGFRDVLEIQRANRRDMYNFRYKKPEPLVPRYLRLEVNERVMSDGTILKDLNFEDIDKVVQAFIKEGVESIVISYINSYVNPLHETKTRDYILKNYPQFKYITLSSEVTKTWGEYERTSTAVINGYIMPKLHDYLKELEDEIRKMGFNGNIFAMLSSGGMSSFEFAKNFPVYTLESGPVAGIMGAIKIAELVGEKDIIAMDGGSTTTKASLVENLTPVITTEYYIGRDKFNAGYPVIVPTIDIVEIGNGGTSIAWIDDVGNLKVGPKAAGAFPGPACYGKGETEPTVTDAYVVTQLLNPNYLLDGNLRIYKDLAEKAINRIAEFFNVSVEEAAWGIIKLANENATNVIRLISIQRGYDTRDFTLIPYGGSGPMFAPFIAQELEIKKIIIPFIPLGVFSAWGMIISPIRHDIIYTEPIRLDRETALERINKIFEELKFEAFKLFDYENVKVDRMNIKINMSIDMRYYGQLHTVNVPLLEYPLTENNLSLLIERFNQIYERRYGYKLPESKTEAVNYHITALLPSEDEKLIFPIFGTENSSLERSIIEEREVYIEDKWVKVKVYDRKTMPLNIKFEGPAIIEDPTSTILVLKDQKVKVDNLGNIQISW